MDQKNRRPLATHICEIQEPPVEVDFALALLKCEPPKIKGGSKHRRDWLGLVMNIQVYCLEYGDGKLFQKVLTE